VLATSAPVTVTWPAFPRNLALGVDTVSPGAGVAVTLTATATDFSVGETIDIADGEGRFEEACSANPCARVDAEDGSDTYTATLRASNYALLATSAPITLTWPAQSLSLILTASTLTPGDGAPVLITATAYGFVPGDSIQIYSEGEVYETCSTDPCALSETESGIDGDTQTAAYPIDASLFNRRSQIATTASPISVTWGP